MDKGKRSHLNELPKSITRLRGNAVALLASLAVAFGPAASVQAKVKSSAPAQTELAKARAMAKSIVEGIHNKKEAVNLLANAGVSVESLRIIDADLAKRMPEKIAMPTLTLVNDEVQVDGKRSGLQITSFNPLKLKYQDRSWAMNEKKSPDQNYAGLMKFLEYHKSVSVLSLAIPNANAFFENGMMGMFSGAAIGGIGAGLFGMAFGFDPLMSMFLGMGGGALVGYFYGKSNEVQSPTAFPAYVPGQPYPTVR